MLYHACVCALCYPAGMPSRMWAVCIIRWTSWSISWWCCPTSALRSWSLLWSSRAWRRDSGRWESVFIPQIFYHSQTYKKMLGCLCINILNVCHFNLTMTMKWSHFYNAKVDHLSVTSQKCSFSFHRHLFYLIKNDTFVVHFNAVELPWKKVLLSCTSLFLFYFFNK